MLPEIVQIEAFSLKTTFYVKNIKFSGNGENTLSSFPKCYKEQMVCGEITYIILRRNF